MTCAVVGLGLMGGSFSLATKNYFKKIIGIDHNKQHQKEALDLGLVDEISTLKEAAKVKKGSESLLLIKFQKYLGIR